jgi:hypothetical protein
MPWVFKKLLVVGLQFLLMHLSNEVGIEILCGVLFTCTDFSPLFLPVYKSIWAHPAIFSHIHIIMISYEG